MNKQEKTELEEVKRQFTVSLTGIQEELKVLNNKLDAMTKLYAKVMTDKQK